MKGEQRVLERTFIPESWSRSGVVTDDRERWERGLVNKGILGERSVQSCVRIGSRDVEAPSSVHWRIYCGQPYKRRAYFWWLFAPDLIP